MNDIASALLADFGDTATRLNLSVGDELVAEGDESDAVFLVVAGELAAYSTSGEGRAEVGRVRAGSVVGEVTVVAGGRRTATLIAAAPTEVAVIGRADFEGWLRERPEVADEVSLQARERIDRVQLVRMFTASLGVSDGDLLGEIVERVEWLRLPAGELLFEQGDEADAAYFVVSGRVVVTMDDGDGSGERRVRELTRGEVVGELGLIEQAPRSATVRAVRDTTLARFDAATFEMLVSEHPQLMLSVARSLLGRLDNGRRRPAVDRATTIALIVACPDPPAGLVDRFVAEVAGFGTVRVLSSEGVDAFLGRPGIAQVAMDNADVPRLAEFLHEAEVASDHVVLLADTAASPWSRRIVRQADRIVIAVSASPDPDEIRLARELLGSVPERVEVHRMLAVVHPRGSSRPSGTRASMDAVGADEVVHLRRGSEADIGRLARLASGHGIGVVLSGGGARGFAHLGVLQALADIGVPVDALGACSIGAPLAGGAALGLEGEPLVETVERQFHRLLDYTIPAVALLKGERISKSITETFEGWDFEDLWLSYYCVSTNLTTSRLEVHRSGDLPRAIRASVAIPGVLPPVPHEGDLLVDGGVLNNLPIEPMRADPRIGTVIAVDVAPPSGPRAKSDYGLSVSGIRAIATNLRHRRTYPSASAVLMRSMLVGAVRNQQRSLQESSVDLMIQLSLPGISLLEFDTVRPVAAVGFEASLPLVQEWAAANGWPRTHDG